MFFHHRDTEFTEGFHFFIRREIPANENDMLSETNNGVPASCFWPKTTEFSGESPSPDSPEENSPLCLRGKTNLCFSLHAMYSQIKER